jgi:hypothetical protein
LINYKSSQHWRVEAQIVSGLKRSATGRLAAAAGFVRQPGSAAPRLAAQLSAGLLRTAAAWGEAVSLSRRAGYWLGTWAVRRSVSPESLAGTSLLFAICAGAWFSAGNGAGAIPALIAAGGWLITLSSARSLKEFAAERATTRPRRETAGDFAWTAALCSAAAECALYGGIAAGAAPRGLVHPWPLAAITVSSIAVAELLAACRAAAGLARNGDSAASQHAAAPRSGWRPSWPLRLSVGGRALFAAAGYIIAGPSAALYAVAGAAGISIVVAIGTLWKAAAGRDGGAGPSGRVLALRDDGALSRWAGRLVQGNLLPLPPAFAGLTATVMLAALGLRHLPGFIALTPPVVMMLAAPGSGHPHDGKFDWLVPALLAAAQFVYFGALGFALAVPGPLVFAACSLTYIWYAGLTGSAAAQAAHPGAPGQAAGWETRLLIIGVAAMLGLPSFGYVGLAAYLGVLIYRKVTIGYLMPRQDGSQ